MWRVVLAGDLRNKSNPVPPFSGGADRRPEGL